MTFSLEKVVPWGRSFEEYIAMFSLSEDDLDKQILGCGDGPAGFNADLSRRGGTVTSVDPIYRFSVDEIQNRIEETYAVILEQTRKNPDEFIWESIKNVDELGRIRMDAMNRFLADYPQGQKQGRYIAEALPDLGFPDKRFDLALCSHFLFLYSRNLTAGFHIESLVELCRLAHEVRIFPLLEFGAKQSRHLVPVIEYLENNGARCYIEKVDYEFQKGGNEMLIIRN